MVMEGIVPSFFIILGIFLMRTYITLALVKSSPVVFKFSKNVHLEEDVISHDVYYTLGGTEIPERIVTLAQYDKALSVQLQTDIEPTDLPQVYQAIQQSYITHLDMFTKVEHTFTDLTSALDIHMAFEKLACEYQKDVTDFTPMNIEPGIQATLSLVDFINYAFKDMNFNYDENDEETKVGLSIYLRQAWLRDLPIQTIYNHIMKCLKLRCTGCIPHTVEWHLLRTSFKEAWVNAKAYAVYEKRISLPAYYTPILETTLEPIAIDAIETTTQLLTGE